MSRDLVMELVRVAQVEEYASKDEFTYLTDPSTIEKFLNIRRDTENLIKQIYEKAVTATEEAKKECVKLGLPPEKVDDVVKEILAEAGLPNLDIEKTVKEERENFKHSAISGYTAPLNVAMMYHMRDKHGVSERDMWNDPNVEEATQIVRAMAEMTFEKAVDKAVASKEIATQTEPVTQGKWAAKIQAERANQQTGITR